MKALLSFQTEGIVLKAIPYRDFDKILTLFTPDQGLLTLFVKGSKRSCLPLLPLATPFTCAEYFYTRSASSSMGRVSEGKILNLHLHLRDSLERLQTAQKLAEALLCSQLPEKPAPALYHLFRLFIEKCAHVSSPATFVPTFYLKILRHEGLLQSAHGCSICDKKSPFRFRGEQFCKDHAPEKALFFTQEEEKLMHALERVRSLSFFSTLNLDVSFEKKIEELFSQAL